MSTDDGTENQEPYSPQFVLTNTSGATLPVLLPVNAGKFPLMVDS
jgi:hypothetical protein